MDLLVGTFLLRPYVFGFLGAFLVAGGADLGWRRTLLFGAWVGPVAWLAEFASTRVGVPFGLYHYTGDTRGQELFIANVPFMDCLSFTFLAYASFCLARAILRARQVPPPVVVLVAGVAMMLLDVVIDPLAVRGDRWFLGRIFYYPEGGVYFGVPLSNFAGWMIVGWVGIGGFVFCSGAVGDGSRRGWPDREARGSDTPGRAVATGRPVAMGRSVAIGGRGADTSSLPVAVDLGTGLTSGRGVGAAGGFDGHGARVWPGIALYYAVLAFNLFVTGWIGEWLLVGVGVALHATVAAIFWSVVQRPAGRLGLEKQRA
jgi:Carotenoid biosynthesis protein